MHQQVNKQVCLYSSARKRLIYDTEYKNKDIINIVAGMNDGFIISHIPIRSPRAVGTYRQRTNIQMHEKMPHTLQALSIYLRPGVYQQYSLICGWHLKMQAFIQGRDVFEENVMAKVKNGSERATLPWQPENSHLLDSSSCCCFCCNTDKCVGCACTCIKKM